MRIPDDDRTEFEQLDDQRRRINDDFNLLVQQIREGAIRDVEKAKLESQRLHVRHEGIIRDMIAMLR